ncbi:BEN domain-containing protein 5-like isoform X1 [Dermacentor andersoni]|uniref:BEN domain-containing protein 5-like isoform X1 n=1 Tax=Dermacentor andersoni TaxID=34620 RepID=UPI002416F9C0|nr:BEN domain-containing protein 5-like isoform X2 [Dermacentor andersoni]
MFALVRFVEDKTDKRYVIPVTDVKNFHPENELDFDNTMPYDAYWRDEDNEENSGVYVVQILKLAATREEMARETKNKRVPIPPIRLSDVEDLPLSEGDVNAKKKNIRQQDKAKQANQAASRKQQYEAVLRQHMAHALKNVDVAKEAAAPLPTPRTSTKQSRGSQVKRKLYDETSDSTDDESLVSSKELITARKDAKYWKMQCRIEREHNASLKKHIEFLENNIRTQLNNCKHYFIFIVIECIICCLTMTTFHVFLVAQILDMQRSERCEGERRQNLEAPLVAPTTEQPQRVAAFIEDAPDLSVPDALDNTKGCQDGNFVATSDGRFHLSGGIYVMPEQAEKLFRNKKPSILVRDTAQVIWGNELLAKRSVSGRLAPTKSGSSEQPSKQLTPAKVEVVYDCLRHWGQIHNQDISAAERALPRTLSEKIQDVKRKLRLPQ